jgi:hypothetical protein
MGDALVKEFIPQLEKNFRCNGARFLRGHSSGGWTVIVFTIALSNLCLRLAGPVHPIRLISGLSESEFV